MTGMKTRHYTLRHTLVVLAAAVGIAGIATGAKKPAPDSHDRLKASYLFMEANNSLQLERPAEAYYMLRRAASLDPSDPDIAAQLGELIIYSGVGDSADFEKAYTDVKNHFFADPSDFHSGLRFAQLAGQLRRFEDVRDTYAALRRAYPNRPDYSLEYAWYRALDYLKGDTAALTEAADIYDRIEEGAGISPHLALHRLRTLMLARDTTAMIGVVHRYLQSTPADAESNYTAGQMFEYIQLGDSALAFYDRACAIDSTYGQAYLARAEHYMADGDSAAYDREVFHALESPSLEFAPKLEILTNYTRALYQQPERREAIAGLFARMLDIHPGEARLHQLYGAYLAALDSTAAAAEQFGYAADLDPDDEDVARFYMQTSLESRDTVAAIETARQASQRFDNIYFPVAGASVLLVSGRHDKALEMLDSFNIAGVDNPQALSVYYQLRGDILHAAGRNDSAYVDYEKAVNYDPANIGVLNNLAYYMSVDGVNLDRAERYIKQVLMQEPLNPTYIDTYAWVLFKQKDYQGARRQIDAALALYASDADSVMSAIDLAGDIVEVSDTAAAETAEAAEIVEAVEEEAADTPSSEIYDHAGDIYFMTGDHREAVQFWEKALLLDPENMKIKKKVTNKAYFFE